jgi:hypothetical protein
VADIEALRESASHEFVTGGLLRFGRNPPTPQFIAF